MKRRQCVEVLILYTGLLLLPEAFGDPCKNATLLHSLYRRLSGYNLAPTDVPLCDKFLSEGWYNTTEFFIATTPPDKCGTPYIWWMDDSKPTPAEVKTEVEKKVCLKTEHDNCEDVAKIKMVDCDGYYVYYLKPTIGCPEAYCLDVNGPKPTGDSSAPSVSLGIPVVEVENNLERTGKKLQFYCKFTPDPDKGLLYTVEWYKGHNTLGSLLAESNPTQFNISWDEFKTKTALHESNMATIGIYIVCSVKARKSILGSPSTGFSSKPFFAGIEVVNKSVVPLDANKEATVYIKSNIPFACADITSTCALYVNTYLPSFDDCSISSLGQTSTDNCGILIPNTEWDQPHFITIVLKTGNVFNNIVPTIMEIPLKTIGEYRPHKIFANHVLPETIKVYVSMNTTILQGKSCHAICDPHMRTFDDLYYENQRSGTFIMYKNTKYPVEVQLKTRSCYRNDLPPFCPCGVAVRAGKDVFVVDKCERPHKIHMQQCLDGVLKGKVTEFGNSYEVFIPTGTIVNINNQPFAIDNLDVIIHPAITDSTHTLGLCGTFDGRPENDLQKRDGTRSSINSPSQDPGDFCLDWGVHASEDLFKASIIKESEAWNKTLYICECNRPIDSQGIIEERATCVPDHRKQCKSSQSNIANAADCGVFRKKKSVDEVSDKYEKHAVDTFEKVTEFSRNKRQIIRPRQLVNFTQLTAHDACWNFLNSSKVFQKCSKVPDLDVNSFVDTCVVDAMLTNSMDWAGSHLEVAKTNCLYQVNVNQPIPADVLAKFYNLTTVANLTGASINSSTSVITHPTNHSSIYNAAFLEDIVSTLCPMECSGQGICKNGTCICNAGFGDVDCSVALNQPPSIDGIPDRGLCDLQKRPCRKTSVLGMNFVKSGSLSCRLQQFEIHRDEKQILQNKVTQNAVRISNVEVECSLPDVLNRRDATPSTGDSSYLARGYRISVSNDGNIFSRETNLLIFDSFCVNCTKAGFNVQCTLQEGFCLMDGKCYRESEISGCQICNRKTDGSTGWTEGTDCPKPFAAPAEEVSHIWIIGTVLGPIGLVSLVVTILIIGKKCARVKKISASQEWTDVAVKPSAR